jgi:hypothetical protein
MPLTPTKQLALCVVASLLALPACQTETCLTLRDGHASCEQRVCVGSEGPAIEVTDARDAEAKLVCLGCEQEHVEIGNYELQAKVVDTANPDPAVDARYSHYQELRLVVGSNWDRTFSAESLNAHLFLSTLYMLAPGRDTSGTSFVWTNYEIESGGVVEASLENGRVRLTLDARLMGASLPNAAPSDCTPNSWERCQCSWDGERSWLSPTRRIEVDLPFALYEPPPPGPSVQIEPALATVCQGECVELRALAQDGIAPLTYGWDRGLPATPGPHRVCPDVTTTFSVLVQDARQDVAFAASANVTVAVRSNCGAPPSAVPHLAECRAEVAEVKAASTYDPHQAQIATDAIGNIYLAGKISGTLDFGGATLSALRDTPSGTAENLLSVFVAKFDPQCRHVWSQGRGGQAWPRNAYATNIYALAVDRAGNLIIAGAFSGPSSPFRGTPRPYSGGEYMVKLSPDGELLSERVFDVSAPFFQASQIMVDEQDNIVLLASMPGDVDPGTGQRLSVPGIVKLDSDGQVLFSRSLAGATAVGLGSDQSIRAYGAESQLVQVPDTEPPTFQAGGIEPFLTTWTAQGDLVSHLTLPLAYAPPYHELYELGGLDGQGNLILVDGARHQLEAGWMIKERRFRADGTLIWNRSSVDSGELCDGPPQRMLAVDSDGSFVRTRRTCPLPSVDPGPWGAHALLKRSPDGEPLWERPLAPDKERPWAMAFTGTRQLVLLSEIRTGNGPVANKLGLTKLAAP